MDAGTSRHPPKNKFSSIIIQKKHFWLSSRLKDLKKARNPWGRASESCAVTIPSCVWCAMPAKRLLTEFLIHLVDKLNRRRDLNYSINDERKVRETLELASEIDESESDRRAKKLKKNELELYFLCVLLKSLKTYPTTFASDSLESISSSAFAPVFVCVNSPRSGRPTISNGANINSLCGRLKVAERLRCRCENRFIDSTDRFKKIYYY